MRSLQSLVPAAMIAAIACLVAPVATPSPAPGAGFLKALEDVPLMDGLTELGDAVVFATDKGRVVTTRAAGRADPALVKTFYIASLPPLGWERDGMMAFHRGTERLSIDIAGGAGDVAVKFELVAKLASTRLPE